MHIPHILIRKACDYNCVMANISIKSQALNMTEGNPTALIIRFAIPMLIGNIFQQLYNLVDSVIVGRYVGSSALASVGATGSVTFLFFALCNGVGSGGGIVTSQYFGKGDEKSVRDCISNTAYIMFGMSFVIGILAFVFSGSVLAAMDTPADILADATAYLKLQCIGLIFVALYNYASSMLRALGDSKTPLYFLVFSCILNTGLDLLFVINFGMGVTGAAIATVISQLVSGAACLTFAIRKNEYFTLTKENLKPNSHIIYQSIRIGVPLSMQFSLIAISCMVLQSVVNGFGPIAVAAFTATSRIEQLIHQPYQTLGASLSTYCGQNYGARKHDRVIEGFKKSMVMMFVFSVLMLPVMQLFGESIVRIFVEDGAVIAMGARALRITSLFYVCLGTIYTVRGVLNGVGDAIFSFVNGVVEVVCRLIFPALMTASVFIGLWGIWYSVGVTWFLSGLTAYMRYASYKKKHLITEPEHNNEITGSNHCLQV